MSQIGRTSGPNSASLSSQYSAPSNPYGFGFATTLEAVTVADAAEAVGRQESELIAEAQAWAVAEAAKLG